MAREVALLQALRQYGALESQLIDLSRDDEPRILSYLDLCARPDRQPPTVVESHGRPCVHVFDGRRGATEDQIGRWCWRIALRGDGAWVGVLDPGSLRIFRTDVKGDAITPVVETTARPGEYPLPRFLNSVSSGQDDIARRRYLTRLLHASAKTAMQQGLSALDALSLVGRGLFWRFLIDRGLLAGLEPSNICATATSWEHCLDSKNRALRTFRWLDETFNGSLLPFAASPSTFDPEVFSATLGNIAHGATESGQLRLPSDWREVNFAHIPVGLLSEVYQVFAHTIDAEDAAAKSIYYTPSHLAEFIVSQVLEQLPDNLRPAVLDPAAGAGVFLVVALRKLVEREWRLTASRPPRARIRAILNQQLTGFDTDHRALRLAELALYLTALELDPKPQPLKALRFEALRDTVLFDLSKIPHGSLGPVGPRFRRRFDIVIGNPPWSAKAHGGTEKKTWVQNSLDVVRERLGEKAATTFDLPDTNTDLPFVWRALEWAKPGGRMALVTHARWLFGQSERMRRARADLLQAVRVTGILNATALRFTSVWPGIDAPWCVLFATNESPRPLGRDYVFQLISLPLDAQRDSEQTRIRVDWLDAQTVSAQDLLNCPWNLKTRFRANRLAVRVLESLRRTGVELRTYLEQLGGIAFKNGYQVGGDARRGQQQSAAHMIGLPDTKGKADQLGFLINTGSLPPFELKKLLHPRDPKIYRAPLLLVAKSIPADRLAVRVSRADTDLAYHESYQGLSFADVANSDAIVRYLQIWLQSSASVFCALLMDGQYGVERDALYKESLDFMPIVPFDRLRKPEQERLVQLSRRVTTLTAERADQLDEFIFDTFDLSDVDREAIRDTLDASSPSAASRRKAVRPTTSAERERYRATLQDSLQSVLSASDLTVAVREDLELRLPPWRLLEIHLSKDTRYSPSPVPAIERILTDADEGGASILIVQATDSVWWIGILDRYQWWTPTRARLLATDLVAQCSPE